MASGQRIIGLPLGVFVVVLVVLPAVLTYGLLQLGMHERHGGVIAAGLLIGAFWLMFLVQVARAGTSERGS